MPGISVSRIPIPFNKGGFSYSSYWTALYAAMTNKPSQAYSLAANTFITSLVNSGVWAKLDRLFVFKAETNAGGEALLDWIHPTGTPAELVNAPTFTANSGFNGDGISSYINTKYNPNTHKVNYALNSGSIGAAIFSKDLSGIYELMGTAVSALYNFPEWGGGGWRGTVNSTGDYNSAAIGGVQIDVLYSVVRPNATTISKYKGATSIGDAAVNSTSIPNAEITLGKVGTAYTTAGISMAYIGAALTQTDITTLNTAWNIFFNGINLNTSAVLVSDADDMYAHESQTLIKSIGGTDYLFILYTGNKVEHPEWSLSARSRLKVFNLSTMALVKDLDVFYPGLVAGITIPANKPTVAHRGYFIGNYLRCHCNNTDTVYQRSLDISSSNPNDWSMGNASIAQMTMKDAGGNDILADVTGTNLHNHLNFVLGDNHASYDAVMPLFRNMDIAKSGANWYATLQTSRERDTGAPVPTILVRSTDSGATWALGSLIAYTPASRVIAVEPSIFFIGTELHIISRSGTAAVLHFKSVDDGATWTQESNIALLTVSSKPCAINTTSNSNVVMAIQLESQVAGGTLNDRTTLGLYTTTNMTTFNKISKTISATYIHYPSLCFYNSHLYISYTKGLTYAAPPDRDAIYFVRVY